MPGIVLLSAALFHSIVFSCPFKDYFLYYSTIMCAFWHMGFDLSFKLYYILFIILLKLWNTSLYSYWVSQLCKTKSHQSSVWISSEWNQHKEYFSYGPALPLTATKDANTVLLFFPFFHPWENFDIWSLHLSAGFSSVAYSSGNATSIPLWILLVWKADKQAQKKHINLNNC